MDEQKQSVDERGTGSKKIPGHIIISDTSDPMAKWYVVHTSSGHEARVAETLRQRVETMGLENKVFEVLVPTQDRVVIRSGKKATVKEKIFGRIVSEAERAGLEDEELFTYINVQVGKFMDRVGLRAYVTGAGSDKRRMGGVGGGPQGEQVGV